MGVHCYLIQIPEQELMHLDEAEIPLMFDRARQDRIDSKARVEVEEMLGGSRDRPTPALYLEKWWWELHVFLTGDDASEPERVVKVSPLSRAILGGEPIGKELHQGPARYLWAEEVREVASALALETGDELLRRYLDPSGRMKASYDAAMKSCLREARLDEETFDWLVGGTDLLASYYRIAAARGNAMLLGLT